MKLYWSDEIGSSEYKYYLLKRQTPTLRPFLEAHNHDYAEIIYIERGNFNHHVNDKEIPVNKGDILFIPPESVFHSIKDYTENLSILQILFPTPSFSFIKNRYTLPEWELLWYIEDQAPCHFHPVQQQWFEKTFNQLLMSDNSLFEIERCLLNLFGLIRDRRIAQSETISEYWLNSALREIQEPENFSRGVQGFAALCGRTPEHVDRELKRRTNQTITDVVNQARMAWASYMLIFSDAEILDIADGCGFESISYFYKLFKNYFNTSPSKYRKSLRSHAEVNPNNQFLTYMNQIPWARDYTS